MDSNNSDQLGLNKILVDLEEEHKHLQLSIANLEHEIEKRAIAIQDLLVEREVELGRKDPDSRKRIKVQPLEHPQHIDKHKEEGEATRLDTLDYSSDFGKQVKIILNNIYKTSEEISALIRL